MPIPLSNSDDAHPRHGAWLSRLKSATPQPIKSALRTLKPRPLEVSPAPIITPATATPAKSGASRKYRQADHWSGDRYTFTADGRTHRCFFITGCYKSGTNWVMNLFNSHPQINCKGEFHFEALVRGFDAFTSQSWFLASRPKLKVAAIDSMQDVVRRMMYAKTRDKPNALWLGDRTPRKLVELLPGAPMVNIRRDGRDVLVSWNFHHLRLKSSENIWVGARPLADRLLVEFKANPAKFESRGQGFLYDEAWFRAHARQWADTVLHDLAAAPRLREAGTPVLEVVYEDLHRNIEAARKELFGFLNLDASSAAPISREGKTLPGVAAPSPTRFMRKGIVGDWRNYFDDRLIQWFKEEAGDALIAAGYEHDASWQ